MGSECEGASVGRNILRKNQNDGLPVERTAGRVGKARVLSGFYSYVEYNEEGSEKKYKIIPVTLYLMNRYGMRD